MSNVNPPKIKTLADIGARLVPEAEERDICLDDDDIDICGVYIDGSYYEFYTDDGSIYFPPDEPDNSDLIGDIK